MIYDNLNIQFTIENTDILVTKISYEEISTPYPSHMHGKNCYELHYVASGNGTLFIDDISYNLIPNTFYVTGPYVSHTQLPAAINPICEYGIFLQLLPHKKSNSHEAIIKLIKENPFWIGTVNHVFLELFEQIFSELDTTLIGYIQNVEALLKMTLITLVRNYTHYKFSDSPIRNTTIENKKRLIIDDMFLREFKTITLSELANILGLSNRQTERFLKEEFGKTFLQKKSEARMSTALILLRNRDYTITYISDSLGYSSSEHFSSAFKSYYGITAREYRKKLY